MTDYISRCGTVLPLSDGSDPCDGAALSSLRSRRAESADTSSGQCTVSAFPHGGISSLDPAQSGAAAPTGKPYDWQLAAREPQEMVALPLEALAGRAFERSEAFRGVLERTAAFLVVASRNNGYEGRDPLLVVDDMQCGTVSSFLGVPLDVLARALLEMQRRGMVAPADDGALRIVDLGAVDRLSGGDAVPA